MEPRHGDHPQLYPPPRGIAAVAGRGSGGFRRGYEGAQELDLFQRVAERSPVVAHIPQVVYHWRAHAGSTASHGKQKHYVFEAARRAIADTVARRQLAARPTLSPLCDREALCLYQLKWDPSSHATTIVIPTRDRADLSPRCVESLVATVDARRVKLIVVDDHSSDPAALAYLAFLERSGPLGCRVVRPPERHGFNYARLMNIGSALCDTPYLLHLNDDVEALTPGWLDQLLGWFSLPEVGVVGALLRYPDGSVQHAGVVLGAHGGLPDHSYHRLPAGQVGTLCLVEAARDVSAVTGACMLIDTKLWRSLGGFDEQGFPVQYNDVDLCLRAAQVGRRVVYTPGAELQHVGSASRGSNHDVREHAAFLRRWRELRDPHRSRYFAADQMALEVDPHRYAHLAAPRDPIACWW